MPKVSVIIPVYNVEKYLRQCLDSVVNQTLKDIEIICVDDGSTDYSSSILNEYAAKDNRIQVIHKANSGYGASVNIGFDKATGEYVAIVEPDDCILPNMYETLYKVATKTQADMVRADYYTFKGNDDHRNKELCEIDFSKKNYNRCINPRDNMQVFNFKMYNWAGIYNRNFIEKYHIRHNETPGASFQDTGFWFQTFCYATKVYFVNEPFYMYRVDNPNASIKSSTKVYALKHEYDFIYNILCSNKDLFDKFINIFWYRKFCSYLWNFYRVESKYKRDFLNVFRSEFMEAYKNGQIDESLFPQWDLETLHNIIKNPKKFYRKATNSLLLWQKIFSITNQNNCKIMTILGIKLKL